MAPLSIDSLRGYVLEEVLAALIRNTGYRLLVDASQDPDVLSNRSNGLSVQGRGSMHQVDVLGELAWIPAFTFPLRLVVEAKARTPTTGLPDVRNAMGVLTDVNQYLLPAGTDDATPLPRFTYRYALFSTSGFSSRAVTYALAHQISLVDLSTPGFVDVVGLADDITTAVAEAAPMRRADGFIRRLRGALRVALGTWPDEITRPQEPAEIGPRAWAGIESTIRAGLDAIGELFVGMANGPYLLVLKARDAERVVEALEQRPVQDVEIHWSLDEDDGTEWTVYVRGDNRVEIPLTFSLPEPVAEWIFDPEADARRRAIQFKERFLSSITIYRYVDRKDRLYRLQFDRGQVDEARRHGRR